MTYIVHAESGRRVGAIGVFHPVDVRVEANTPEAAILKAYDHVDSLLLPSAELEDAFVSSGNGIFIDGITEAKR